MKTIERMGKFTAIGMRTPTPEGALVINTCADNDTDATGTLTRWSWSNPTNRRYPALYNPQPGEVVQAASTEAMWQGTKIFAPGGRPDERTLAGDWRHGKAKRPIGAWAGEGQPLLTTAGAARRAIYLPAFRSQIEHWIFDSAKVREWLDEAGKWQGDIFLRDFDTGRGVERNGPMSHAWVLATYLNTSRWP